MPPTKQPPLVVLALTAAGAACAGYYIGHEHARPKQSDYEDPQAVIYNERTGDLLGFEM